VFICGLHWTALGLPWTVGPAPTVPVVVAYRLTHPEGLWNLEQVTSSPRLAAILAETFATWEDLAVSTPAQRWTRVGAWAASLVVPPLPQRLEPDRLRWSVSCFERSWPLRLQEDHDLAATLWGYGVWPRRPLVTVLAGAYSTPQGRRRAERALTALRGEEAALVAPVDHPLASQADLLVCAGDPTTPGQALGPVLRVIERGGAVTWSGGPRSGWGEANRFRAADLAVALSEVAVVADVAPHPLGGGQATATALRLGRPMVPMPALDGDALVEALHRSLAGDRQWARNILDAECPGWPQGDGDLAAALNVRLCL
jgi:hypothetical protein